MNSNRTWNVVIAGVIASLLIALVSPTATAAGATVTIRPDRTYQTVRGWSCNPHYLRGSRPQREQVIDEAVDSLGITRIRWQQPSGNRSNMRRWELGKRQRRSL